MNEAQWLACEYAGAMLEWLESTRTARGALARQYDADRQRYDGGPSQRKLRLFAVACWRRFPKTSGLTWPPAAAERLADGGNVLAPEGGYRTWVLTQDAAEAARCGVRASQGDAGLPHLLRDIVGTPHRPYHVRWAGGPIPSLAQAAYDERTPGRPHKRCGCGRAYEMLKRSSTPPMAWCNNCRAEGGWYADAVARESDGSLDPFRLALLADALEEAGCDDLAVLNGLRGLSPCAHDAGPCDDCGGSGWRPSPVPRYRGFWPLDLILGRE